ncbi:protein ECERIFERUM 1-like isoform X1 [Cucumis melo var. makuwa]|uniref:Protein ECERIFERUM 1-like isoform X1 n=1 Tax=Cucumis melo var. makuwa TaxID=1194695 RepID=A0A5D3D1I1_CUCMM|nr:protein ECERIFERUM 1-like isoform X1 [Cucumis melo var. makuwa]
MASTPGILTDWPWKTLGSFKYVILAPWVVHSIYQYVVKDETERDVSSLVIFPFLLWRIIHNQIWISVSRYRTAKGNARILDKGIEFDQVDREGNWDDQILLNGLLLYIVSYVMEEASKLPLWRTDGMVIIFLLHIGPVEFLYYWLHRALHHHYLYSRYHSHHHSSIVTQPITSVIHPFVEELAYFGLFAIPIMTAVFSGTMSVAAYVVYITYIDFMNNMGHCNFEFIPNRLFTIFPPLKFLIYTPSFHSLHHTKFRTNYSLFMPFYDYIYATFDKSSDTLYKESLRKEEDVVDVVHLTHLTSPESIYHLRLGFATLASRPHTSTWYLWLLYPITLVSMLLTWIYGRTFVVERNQTNELNMQTWMIPKYKFQGDELNKHGAIYVERNPKLKVRVVDGNSLAVAVVLNNIPKFATQVLLIGKVPSSLQNLHSCENWLPRRVMSAWRVAGIVHAMEGWTEHECGDAIFDVEQVWLASLRHGFQPLEMPATTA